MIDGRTYAVEFRLDEDDMDGGLTDEEFEALTGASALEEEHALLLEAQSRLCPTCDPPAG